MSSLTEFNNSKVNCRGGMFEINGTLKLGLAYVQLCGCIKQHYEAECHRNVGITQKHTRTVHISTLSFTDCHAFWDVFLAACFACVEPSPCWTSLLTRHLLNFGIMGKVALQLLAGHRMSCCPISHLDPDYSTFTSTIPFNFVQQKPWSVFHLYLAITFHGTGSWNRRDFSAQQIIYDF